MVLIGFAGTGKSVVGKALAARLGYDFIDTDRMIEGKSGMRVGEIFAQLGESEFRRLECEAVAQAASRNKSVIATGGGAVLDPANVRLLALRGTLVGLTSSVDAIHARTRRYARPLLAAAPGEGPKERIRRLLAERAPAYAQARFTVDTTNRPVSSVVDQIQKLIGRGEDQ